MSALTESCGCGATLNVSDRNSSATIANYQAEDFRKAHAVCRQPTVGRCGVESKHPMAPAEATRTFCALPHGHDGWHRDDNGMEWTLTERTCQICSRGTEQPEGVPCLVCQALAEERDD